MGLTFGRDVVHMTQLIEDGLPKVTELKIHLNMRRGRSGRLHIPGRSEFEVLVPLVEYGGVAATIHIGLHVPGKLRLAVRNGDEEARAARLKEVVEYLNSEAEEKGKRVRFAVWQ